MNKFFNSTFSNSCFKLPPISELPTPSSQLHEISFDSFEVYEVLCKLDTTKAMGIDDLHPHLLKLCALMIHEPITSLFNSIIKTQLIPEDKIIPVPKKGDLTLVQNYRPISLLYILQKVLERLIYNKIIDFIKPRITSQQFGFLKHRSYLASISCSSYLEVVDSLNSGDSCGVVYLDLAKAFDKVPHSELLYKLWITGITGNLWKWFRNYLSNRSHFFQFDSYIRVAYQSTSIHAVVTEAFRIAFIRQWEQKGQLSPLFLERRSKACN